MDVDSFIKNISVKSTLNQEDDSLPYGYIHPALDGRLIWLCGIDAGGKITSVSQFTDADGKIEKKCDYLKDFDEAKKYRKALIDEGWIKMETPEVTFSYSNSGESKTELNRNERRRLKKQFEKQNSKNPFK
ncbi:hypothetical protein OAG24_00595 [bacterium]|nr:hypothetical protein [bacterium]